jgi:hypothetical protein
VTEAEWLTCVHPDKLLRAQRHRGNRRRWALYVCACCRRGWGLLTDAQARQAVELAGRAADLGWRGRAARELQAIFQAAERRTWKGGAPWTGDLAAVVAYAAINPVWSASRVLELLTQALERTLDDVPPRGKRARRRAHRQAWCDLLRDVLGNPDRPAALDPAWLTWGDGLVAVLARQIYDERDFAAQPVLADALEDAGCADADLLGHLRGPGPHDRGCWAVDLLLGKG